MSEPRLLFIEGLMAEILRLTMVPKVQVERAIAPILGLFIEEVLSKQWGKKVKIICEEFPLLKSETQTYQSTNVDWLLYSFGDNDDDGKLVFLELKTACTSFDASQGKRYLDQIEKILESGLLFLVKGLGEIKDVSREREKYEKLWTRVHEDSRYSVCKKARLVYLAPAAMRNALPKPLNDGVEWLSFGDLPKDIGGDFALEWEVIRRNLVKLDSIMPHSRNGLQVGGERRNYSDTVRFEEVMGLCEKSEDTIVVGFEGGARKLLTATLDELNKRHFKWDQAELGKGVKAPRNWIPGRQFLEIVKALMDD